MKYLGAEELTVDTTDCLVNSGRSSSDLWIGSSIIVPDFCLWNSESICVLVLSGCSGAPIKIIQILSRYGRSGLRVVFCKITKNIVYNREW